MVFGFNFGDVSDGGLKVAPDTLPDPEKDIDR